MSFGRNPHVAKAEAEEQKALVAKDDRAREQAWREAARQWDRAADRETQESFKTKYTERAEVARSNADAPEARAPGEASEADAEKIETADDLLANVQNLPPELLN